MIYKHSISLTGEGCGCFKQHPHFLRLPAGVTIVVGFSTTSGSRAIGVTSVVGFSTTFGPRTLNVPSVVGFSTKKAGTRRLLLTGFGFPSLIAA
ncbi:hypothetical protein NST69_30290 [Paenibacillus sp. FSL P2-0089]|uniref:hypothetical protein n=1 Tax=Paenibacillus sp. FSL P2-0089 TaxID=2954526 RepID=UPI00315A2EED